MRFARWVFGISGVLGILMVAPAYFLEVKLGQDYPPPINHPEYFYGFVGVTLAWQILFVIIATDPIRLRPAMPAAVCEKLFFVLAVPVLYWQGRVPVIWLGAVAFDGTWMVLFAVAYWVTRAGSPLPAGERG
jgi:hypothetical protein